MNCEQLRAESIDYVYDILKPEVRESVDEHLRECETCRVDIESMRQARRVLEAAVRSADDRSEADPARIVRQAARGTHARARRWKVAALLLAAAIVLLSVAVLTRLRVEFDGRRLVIGLHHAGERDVPHTAPIASDPAELAATLARHDRQMQGLDRLVRLMVQVMEKDQTDLDERLLELKIRMNQLSDRGETRWRTVQFMLLDRQNASIDLPAPTNLEKANYLQSTSESQGD